MQVLFPVFWDIPTDKGTFSKEIKADNRKKINKDKVKR
jgi:hypothetical protein